MYLDKIVFDPKYADLSESNRTKNIKKERIEKESSKRKRKKVWCLLTYCSIHGTYTRW